MPEILSVGRIVHVARDANNLHRVYTASDPNVMADQSDCAPAIVIATFLEAGDVAVYLFEFGRELMLPIKATNRWHWPERI